MLPDDVQAVWPAVAGHRLEARGGTGVQPLPREQLLRAILEAVPVPR